jgi:hypothetical protein
VLAYKGLSKTTLNDADILIKTKLKNIAKSKLSLEWA